MRRTKSSAKQGEEARKVKYTSTDRHCVPPQPISLIFGQGRIERAQNLGIMVLVERSPEYVGTDMRWKRTLTLPTDASMIASPSLEVTFLEPDTSFAYVECLTFKWGDVKRDFTEKELSEAKKDFLKEKATYTRPGSVRSALCLNVFLSEIFQTGSSELERVYNHLCRAIGEAWCVELEEKENFSGPGLRIYSRNKYKFVIGKSIERPKHILETKKVVSLVDFGFFRRRTGSKETTHIGEAMYVKISNNVVITVAIFNRIGNDLFLRRIGKEEETTYVTETEMRDEISLSADVLLSDGHRDAHYTGMKIAPLNKLLDQSLYGYYHAVRDSTEPCVFHRFPNEKVFAGRANTRSLSQLECRLPNLTGLASAFLAKYRDLSSWEVWDVQSTIIRCPDCLWEASIANGRRTVDESRAAGMSICTNCASVVVPKLKLMGEAFLDQNEKRWAKQKKLFSGKREQEIRL